VSTWSKRKFTDYAIQFFFKISAWDRLHNVEDLAPEKTYNPCIPDPKMA